eukprot:4659481-Amphidinium_carterae.1
MLLLSLNFDEFWREAIGVKVGSDMKLAAGTFYCGDNGLGFDGNVMYLLTLDHTKWVRPVKFAIRMAIFFLQRKHSRPPIPYRTKEKQKVPRAWEYTQDTGKLKKK